jgi:hypothetical protein
VDRDDARVLELRDRTCFAAEAFLPMRIRSKRRGKSLFLFVSLDAG